MPFSRTVFADNATALFLYVRCRVYRSGALYARRFSQSAVAETDRRRFAPRRFCFRVKRFVRELVVGRGGYASNFKASLTRYYALQVAKGRRKGGRWWWCCCCCCCIPGNFKSKSFASEKRARPSPRVETLKDHDGNAYICIHVMRYIVHRRVRAR